jgi:8-oxo-dGTP pyrophosphatase MutT (NUDIX family)
MPRFIRNVATGTVIHGGVDVLLGKHDQKTSWAKHGSPLRWGFFGGKVMKYESPLDAFVRELPEEIGLTPIRSSTEKVAIILLHKKLPNGTYKHLRMHVFLATKWTGLPHQTDEMEGWRWCNQNALPRYTMLATDPIWMPLVFHGKKIIVSAFTDYMQKHLLPGKKVLIREVDHFPEDRPLRFRECLSLV